MAQIYKIYMNRSALVLADFVPDNLTNIQLIDGQQLDLGKLFREAKEKRVPVNYLLHSTNPKALLGTLKMQVKVIKAAGGLVKNGSGDYLFIHRLGKWDLPKGKVDNGESMKKAAVREVEEECGIQVDYLGRKIRSTYHVYQLKGELVLKKTNWYEMGVNKVPKLKPQWEEDITDAIWLAAEKLAKIRKNTYPLVEDILDGISPSAPLLP